MRLKLINYQKKIANLQDLKCKFMKKTLKIKEIKIHKFTRLKLIHL